MQKVSRHGKKIRSVSGKSSKCCKPEISTHFVFRMKLNDIFYGIL